MTKPGVALTDVKGFPLAAAETLRDQVSVTTAEEFVDLATRMGPALERMLRLDGRELARLRHLAEQVAEPVDTNDATYHTGMEPPPTGQRTY